MPEQTKILQDANRTISVLQRIWERRMQIIHEFVLLKKGSLKVWMRKKEDTDENEAKLLKKLSSVNSHETTVLNIIEPALEEALKNLQQETHLDFLEESAEESFNASKETLLQLINKFSEQLPTLKDFLEIEKNIANTGDRSLLPEYFQHIKFFQNKMANAISEDLSQYKEFVMHLQEACEKTQEAMAKSANPKELVLPSVVNGIIRVGGATALSTALGGDLPSDFGMFVLRVGAMSALISFFDYYTDFAKIIANKIVGGLQEGANIISEISKLKKPSLQTLAAEK